MSIRSQMGKRTGAVLVVLGVVLGAVGAQLWPRGSASAPVELSAVLVPGDDPRAYEFVIRNDSEVEVRLNEQAIWAPDKIYSAAGVRLPTLPPPVPRPFDESRDLIVLMPGEELRRGCDVSSLARLHQDELDGFFVQCGYLGSEAQPDGVLQVELRTNAVWVDFDVALATAPRVN